MKVKTTFISCWFSNALCSPRLGTHKYLLSERGRRLCLQYGVPVGEWQAIWRGRKEVDADLPVKFGLYSKGNGELSVVDECRCVLER